MRPLRLVEPGPAGLQDEAYAGAAGRIDHRTARLGRVPERSAAEAHDDGRRAGRQERVERGLGLPRRVRRGPAVADRPYVRGPVGFVAYDVAAEPVQQRPAMTHRLAAIATRGRRGRQPELGAQPLHQGPVRLRGRVEEPVADGLVEGSAEGRETEGGRGVRARRRHGLEVEAQARDAQALRDLHPHDHQRAEHDGVGALEDPEERAGGRLGLLLRLPREPLHGGHAATETGSGRETVELVVRGERQLGHLEADVRDEVGDVAGRRDDDVVAAGGERGGDAGVGRDVPRRAGRGDDDPHAALPCTLVQA